MEGCRKRCARLQQIASNFLEARRPEGWLDFQLLYSYPRQTRIGDREPRKCTALA